MQDSISGTYSVSHLGVLNDIFDGLWRCQGTRTGYCGCSTLNCKSHNNRAPPENPFPQVLYLHYSAIDENSYATLFGHLLLSAHRYVDVIPFIAKRLEEFGTQSDSLDFHVTIPTFDVSNIYIIRSESQNLGLFG